MCGLGALKFFSRQNLGISCIWKYNKFNTAGIFFIAESVQLKIISFLFQIHMKKKSQLKVTKLKKNE